MYVHICACVGVSVYVFVCVYGHVWCVFSDVCPRMCVHICVHMCVYVDVCTNVHMSTVGMCRSMCGEV